MPAMATLIKILLICFFFTQENGEVLQATATLVIPISEALRYKFIQTTAILIQNCNNNDNITKCISIETLI